MRQVRSGGKRAKKTKESAISFVFQAEDGIRDAQESRGLGDVYKRQLLPLNQGQVHKS